MEAPPQSVSNGLLKNLKPDPLCFLKGWALGTAEFKAGLVRDHGMAAKSRAWESQGAHEIRQEQWHLELQRCLAKLGRDADEAKLERKSAPWKIAIACHMKQRTQASNRWLCEMLHMGTPVGVSQMVGRFRRDGGPAAECFEQLTEKPKT